jgi:hypothetical protein
LLKTGTKIAFTAGIKIGEQGTEVSPSGLFLQPMNTV